MTERMQRCASRSAIKCPLACCRQHSTLLTREHRRLSSSSLQTMPAWATGCRQWYPPSFSQSSQSACYWSIGLKTAIKLYGLAICAVRLVRQIKHRDYKQHAVPCMRIRICDALLAALILLASHPCPAVTSLFRTVWHAAPRFPLHSSILVAAERPAFRQCSTVTYIRQQSGRLVQRARAQVSTCRRVRLHVACVCG